MSISAFFTTQKTFFGYFLPFLYLLATECISYVVTPFYASKIDNYGIHLVGVALGFTIYNLVIVSTMFGYASIFETYGPQMYSSEKSGSLGTLLVKCFLQGLLVFMFVLGPYYNITHLVSYLVAYVKEKNVDVPPDPELSIEQVTRSFLVYTAGFGLVDYCVDILNKYLVTQKRMLVVYLCSTVYLVVYVAALHVSVVVFRFAVSGIALSMYLARGVNLLLQIGYCCYANRTGNIAWEGLNFGVFDGWGEMVKLGVSSILHMLADTGVVEFATFVALFAGQVQMSVVVVNFESYILILSATFAHCYATSLMLGAAMGESNRQKTVLSLCVIVVNVFLISVPLAVINWVLRYEIVKLFTDDAEVVELFGSIVWITCVFTPINYCVNILTRGVLVAFGRQRFTALLSSFSSYILGIPLMLAVIFKTSFGAKGIFYVFLIFAGFKLAVVLIKLYFIDVGSELKDSQKRIEEFDTKDVHDKNAYIKLGTNSTTTDAIDNTTVKNSNMDNKRQTFMKFGFLFVGACIWMSVGIYLSQLRL